MVKSKRLNFGLNDIIGRFYHFIQSCCIIFFIGYMFLYICVIMFNQTRVFVVEIYCLIIIRVHKKDTKKLKIENELLL